MKERRKSDQTHAIMHRLSEWGGVISVAAVIFGAAMIYSQVQALEDGEDEIKQRLKSIEQNSRATMVELAEQRGMLRYGLQTILSQIQAVEAAMARDSN